MDGDPREAWPGAGSCRSQSLTDFGAHQPVQKHWRSESAGSSAACGGSLAATCLGTALGDTPGTPCGFGFAPLLLGRPLAEPAPPPMPPPVLGGAGDGVAPARSDGLRPATASTSSGSWCPPAASTDLLAAVVQEAVGARFSDMTGDLIFAVRDAAKEAIAAFIPEFLSQVVTLLATELNLDMVIDERKSTKSRKSTKESQQKEDTAWLHPAGQQDSPRSFDLPCMQLESPRMTPGTRASPSSSSEVQPIDPQSRQDSAPTGIGARYSRRLSGSGPKKAASSGSFLLQRQSSSSKISHSYGSEKDVKSLENALADQLLEEEGYSQKKQKETGSQPKRSSSDTLDCSRAGPTMPVIPSVENLDDFPLAPSAGVLPGCGAGELHAEQPVGPERSRSGSRKLSADSCRSVSKSTTVERCASMRSRSRHVTAGEVLHLRIRELTDGIPTGGWIGESLPPEDEGAAVPLPVPALLAISGLIGWEGLRSPKAQVFYRCFIGLVTAAASVGTLIELAAAYQGLWSISTSCEKPVCWRQRGLWSGIPAAVGPLIGFLLLQPWKGSTCFFQTLKLLQSYGSRMGLAEQLQRGASYEMCWAFVIWLCVAASAGVGLFYDAAGGPPSWPAMLSMASFSFLVGIYMCLCFGHLYVCRALMMFVDTFCAGVIDSPVISDAAHRWNVLQAVLRKGSSSIECCFIALQGMGAFTMPLLIADFIRLGMHHRAFPALIPGLVLALGVFRVVFLAAAVTDKCARVPSLLNTLHFGEKTELQRQYIVQYVTNSAAGFHVFDLRLTTGMALKYLYIWIMVALGLWTQLTSQAE